MAYANRRRGFTINRFIFTGSIGYMNGKANQVFGYATVDASGIVQTYPSTVDEVCVQLPQPRQNSPLSAYVATYPLATAVVLPNPTDSLLYLWDIGPFSPALFAANPIPGLPDPATAKFVLRMFGNGTSGGTPTSSPASPRTSNTGSYKIPINTYFANGLFGFFQNPEKLPVITYNNLAGGPFVVGDQLTGSGGSAGSGGRVAQVIGGATLVLERVDSGLPGAVISPEYTVGRHITGSVSGAQADIVTYESQLGQQFHCQIHVSLAPGGRRRMVQRR